MVKCKSRQEQRERYSANMMTALQLELHLRNLLREALDPGTTAGDKFKAAADFQQYVQYAPLEMKVRVNEFLITL